MTASTVAVLRCLLYYCRDEWTGCPVIVRRVRGPATTTRRRLRQLAACGWVERRWRLGSRPALAYRLTNAGRAAARAWFSRGRRPPDAPVAEIGRGNDVGNPTIKPSPG
jgi:DNA-binding IclR family transcriptional regulator